MPHHAAFHQCLHCLLRFKQSSDRHNWEMTTCDPLKYIMVNLILITFICVGKSIRIQRVKCKMLIQIKVLAFCIRTDFPILIDTISVGLPIVYFKGSQVEFSKLWCFSVPDGCLNLRKQCRPWWNAALCFISSVSSFHLCLHCLSKYLFMGFQYTKG